MRRRGSVSRRLAEGGEWEVYSWDAGGSAAEWVAAAPRSEIAENVAVEFLEYREVLPALTRQGLAEAEDGEGLIRLEFDPDPRLKCVHYKDPASTFPPYPDAAVKEKSKDALPELVRQIIVKMNLNDVQVIPVGAWRDVLDCVAFELANDEHWREVDALAAMHQKTRNPLIFAKAETPILAKMIKALLTGGTTARHDVIITSDARPLLLEIFHDGAFSLTCESGMSDQALKGLG